MAAVCWFYHYTPDQFRALKLSDFKELTKFMREYHEAQRKR